MRSEAEKAKQEDILKEQEVEAASALGKFNSLRADLDEEQRGIACVERLIGELNKADLKELKEATKAVSLFCTVEYSKEVIHCFLSLSLLGALSTTTGALSKLLLG